MRAAAHSLPRQCGPDRGSNWACIDGDIYAPCESEYCYDACQPHGACDCSCHGETEETTR